MSAFEYWALDATGKKQQGSLDCDGERHARQLLRAQGLFPVKITPLHSRKSEHRQNAAALRKLDLAIVSRHLASLFATGIPVADALQTVAEQADKKAVKRVIQGVRGYVLEGYTLATSLGNFPRAFPPIYVATVAAGENSGQLDHIFNGLADYLEQQQTMHSKIMQALLYPALMLFVSCGVLIFLLTFVVPKMVAVFSDAKQTLPLLTRMLLWISHIMQQQGIYWLVILFAFMMAFRYFLRRPTIKFRVQLTLLRIPIIGRLVLQINLARFAYTMALLLNAGVDILQALASANEVLTLLPLKTALKSARLRVSEGMSLSTALKQTGYFPPLILHLVANGEATAQLPAMLAHAAKQQNETVSRYISAGLTLFEPLLILLMGSMVLFIVLAILLPIFSLDQLVRL